MYILQPKTDHQGSKIPFTDFWWIGPYIIEKVLAKNNYLVRKIGTNRRQLLLRMKLRHFTSRQPLPDIPITPRERHSDPELVIKHDYLYARAWECENDEPIFDYNKLVTPSSPETTIQSEQAANELKSTPGTIPEDSPEMISQPDRSYGGMDTNHGMQLEADTSVPQFDPTPTNPLSSKYDLRQNPKPTCNDDYRY